MRKKKLFDKQFPHLKKASDKNQNIFCILLGLTLSNADNNYRDLHISVIVKQDVVQCVKVSCKSHPSGRLSDTWTKIRPFSTHTL